MNFNNITLEISAGRKDQLLKRTVPEIAFSGKSNVGKSSLINVLVNRKALARVSATPGKTVTINYYNIDNTCRFVDLPGYGYAKVSRENKGAWSPVADKYLRDGRCDLLIQLLDMRHDPTQLDVDMLNFIYEMKLPHILVLTKSDKLKKSEFDDILTFINDNFTSEYTRAVIPFSALNRSGKEEILEEINKIIAEFLM